MTVFFYKMRTVKVFSTAYGTPTASQAVSCVFSFFFFGGGGGGGLHSVGFWLVASCIGQVWWTNLPFCPCIDCV